MMRIDRKRIFLYVITNLSMSLILSILRDYLGLYREGILHFLGLILFAPAFYVLFLLSGPTYAMHFATENTFRIVSFIFYSAVIALIQFVIFKRRKKNNRN